MRRADHEFRRVGKIEHAGEGGETPFWSESPDIVADKLRCSTEGLTSEEAARRLDADGPNADAPSKSESYWRSIVRRLLEPLSLILLGAGIVSIATGDMIGGSIANILKYIRMGASSNFGNMLSMAIASVALPFLPMLPTQILLNNLLYDLSELGIPFDGVRPDAVAKPQHWEMDGLMRFAGVMGPLSSVFDMLTFAVLLFGLHASPEEFRTAWFIESMATQILVIFIIRTNGRPWRDFPRAPVTVSSLGALAIALVPPFSPIGYWFGFAPPSAATLGIITLVVLGYLGAAELLKPLAVRSDVRHRTYFQFPTWAASRDLITS